MEIFKFKVTYITVMDSPGRSFRSPIYDNSSYQIVVLNENKGNYWYTLKGGTRNYKEEIALL